MSQMSALALLWSARNLIARIPSWRLIAADRSAALDLMDRLDLLLNGSAFSEARDDFVGEVRENWRDLPDIEVEESALTRQDERGLWVCAWLLTGPANTSLDPEEFRDALASLPLMAREVYRLHRIDWHSLEETGRQLGLDLVSAQAQLSQALRKLHERLYPGR